jgi:DNA-binding NtrC family response regulator
MKEKIKILVVDDEELIRWSLGKYLESAGYSVDIVMNGREALERIEADEYDLVVTDLNMPELGGTELLMKIEESGKSPPVIIISSFIPEITVNEPPFKNAFKCINKPFKMEDMLSLVKEAVECGQ